MIEVWKDIIEFEGLYQISNLGNVKSLSRYYYCGNNYSTLKYCREKLLKFRFTKTGYTRVVFNLNGKNKDFYVHKLVAYYFLDNPNNYVEINHKDENKANNYYYNLEWCNHIYNCNYGTRNDKVSLANKEYRRRLLYDCN